MDDWTSAIASSLKPYRGRCLDAGGALAGFAARNPECGLVEMRRVALLFGRAPFPSIEGNPPKDRSRPYWDGRYLERITSSEGDWWP